MTAVRRELPSGTVTFLFTDVEGSTKLLHELGPDEYAEALAEHRRILRGAFGAHGGVEVDTQGDAFFVAFPTAPRALEAAAEALAGLAPGPIRVRIGVHTGTPHVAEEGYVGADVHRAARIAACGHGGQVLVSAATASLLDQEGLRDLGEHRLKDLSAPERIYQLGDDHFPPLESLHRTNLPIPATPFLGREQELAQVLALLSRDDIRLLTLTGPGGTGKTRLAAQAAAELALRYPQGVWWIPLAPLRDPKLVVDTAAEALGATDGLAEHVADRSVLLLFDNFEHVVEAAGDLAALLAACPKLDLLVTSREPLHLTGEQEYPVPPLVHEEGIEFFIARARAVRPDFRADEAVSAICRRLDELPLALELAGARVKALSAGQILDRLEQRLPLLTGGPRDLPERQRTLRATIAWSHELLTPEERRLFARLAVFSGGCTLEAAEQVTEANLDTLQSLVDKSLLRQTDDRFWMLETIREYALEQLEQGGDANVLRRRHAEYFRALAEEAEREHAEGGEEAGLLERLEAEHDNFRAALGWAATDPTPGLEVALAGALAPLWRLRGHISEGRRWLETALSRGGDAPASLRTRALDTAAGLAYRQGDNKRSTELWEEALALSRETADASQTARVLAELGSVAVAEGDYERARKVYEESIAVFRDAGDLRALTVTLSNLASVANLQGDYERGRRLAQEALALLREHGQKESISIVLHNLGRAELRQHRGDEARELLAESLELAEALGFKELVAYCLEGFGEIAAAAENWEEAARLIGAADVLFEQLGIPLGAEEREGYEATVALLETQLSPEDLAAANASGRELGPEQAIACALKDPNR
jgi:predicted ATPase/class 3 adenylate cyclase/Tfp pilus assembly protein PilF